MDDSMSVMAPDRLLSTVGRALQESHEVVRGAARCARGCSGALPCSAHRVGVQAVAASTAGWLQRWTLRHDLRSVGLLQVAYACDVDQRGGAGPDPDADGSCARDARR